MSQLSTDCILCEHHCVILFWLIKRFKVEMVSDAVVQLQFEFNLEFAQVSFSKS